jgi:hypothetical protein
MLVGEAWFTDGEGRAGGGGETGDLASAAASIRGKKRSISTG